jgi:hypothetical protein
MIVNRGSDERGKTEEELRDGEMMSRSHRIWHDQLHSVACPKIENSVRVVSKTQKQIVVGCTEQQELKGQW